MRTWTAPVLAAALTCTGCTLWTSETLEQIARDERTPRGVFYALPMGVVDIKLEAVPEKARFLLTVSGPRTKPDPLHQYILRYQPHPSYSDDVEVSTTKAGLLAEVKSKTKDQTPGIILNLVRALAGGSEKREADKLETGEGATTKVELLSLAIDPLDSDQRRDAIADIDKAVVAFRDKMLDGCSKYDKDARYRTYLDLLKQRLEDAELNTLVLAKLKTDAGKLTDAARETLLGSIGGGRPPALSCRARAPSQALSTYCTLLKQEGEASAAHSKKEAEAKELADKIRDLQTQKTKPDHCALYTAMAKPPRATIDVCSFDGSCHFASQIRHVAIKPARAVTAPKADCTIGVCYRPKKAYRIEYGIGGGRMTLNAELPNETDIVAIDISRAFLVQKVQNIEFDDGYLKSLHIDKKSELLAASQIPVDILSAVAEGLAFRAKVTTTKKNLTQSEIGLLDAEKKLAEEQKKLAESAPKAPATSRNPPAPSFRPAVSP